MQNLQNLPLGSQTFSYIIEQNAVYVDKTKYMHALIANPVNKYFLSRPRRFGKSLTLSTLDAIFSGKKELFKGLFIAEKTDYNFATFPVLRFDFSRVGHQTGAELSRILTQQILNYAKEFGHPIDTNASGLSEIWDTLIQHFKSKNQKIVILIDEYDKPILDHITNLPIARENRDVLKGFYEIIKANDETIRFLFITGITKFSQMNIFSGLNNLRDISLDVRYAAICGYTQDELEASFRPHLESFAEAEGTAVASLRDKIRHWYNGFRFTKSPITVYNPFSTLMLLETQTFQYHWFSTGTPTYLMQLFQSLHVDPTQVPDMLSINDTASYELDNFTVNLPALLFQTGYRTIVSASDEGLLRLDYPNLEVKEAFTQKLLQTEIRSTTSPEVTILELRHALQHTDIEEVFRILKLFFSKIPYDIQEPTEKYYQSLFHLIFTVIGTRIHSEVRTNTGRVDALVETAADLYLFEFKINQTAEAALAQIDAKDYAFSFGDSGKKIHKIGVNFSIAERNISEWRIG